MAITPINGLSSSYGPSGIPPVPAVGPVAEEPVGADPSSAADDAVSVETSSASPPPEVLAAIANASAAFDDLAAQGLHVSFNDSEDSGFGMSLQDEQGTVLSALTAGDVLSIADGNAPKPPEGPASASTAATPETRMSTDGNGQYGLDD